MLRDARAVHKIKHPQRQLGGASQIGMMVLSSAFISFFESAFCSFIMQKRWWRLSTPTLQPSNPLSAVAATLAQRLPWLAQQHITYAHTHMDAHTHTHDISSLASQSQTATHTNGDTNTQAYTLWHFPVKRTSVHSSSHRHHYIQHSFVEEDKGLGGGKSSERQRLVRQRGRPRELKDEKEVKKKKKKNVKVNHMGKKKNAAKRERHWDKETTDR